VRSETGERERERERGYRVGERRQGEGDVGGDGTPAQTHKSSECEWQERMMSQSIKPSLRRQWNQAVQEAFQLYAHLKKESTYWNSTGEQVGQGGRRGREGGKGGMAVDSRGCASNASNGTGTSVCEREGGEGGVVGRWVGGCLSGWVCVCWCRYGRFIFMYRFGRIALALGAGASGKVARRSMGSHV
jgi:hypothetical protein